MEIIFYVAIALFGLAAGSFVNVLTLRYRPERSFFSRASWGGRSRCPACGAALRWYELIPIVSFVLQRGKCRSCAARLPRQYPLVEFAAAALAVGVPLFFSSWHGVRDLATGGAPGWYYLFLLLWYLVGLVWLSVFIIDVRHYLIPDELNLVLLALGIGITALTAAHAAWLPPFRLSFLKHYTLLFSVPSLEGVWAMHLAGAIAGGTFFWLLSLLTRGVGMGFGDVKFVLASGFILGFPDIAFAAALAFILGGIWGGTLIALGKKRMGEKLPFAPFLVIGFLLSMFGGFPILSWYFSLLNF